MLVLGLRNHETAHLYLPSGEVIRVTVTETRPGLARLGFTAPDDVKILRDKHLPLKPVCLPAGRAS